MLELIEKRWVFSLLFKRKCVWFFFNQTVLSWLGKNKQPLPPDFYIFLSILSAYLLLFYLRPKEEKHRKVQKKKKNGIADTMGEGSTL